MHVKYFLIVLTTLFFFSNYSHADARLEKKLGLNSSQAKQVQQIEKHYRKEFRSSRQKLHRELRKMRRARIAHDSATVAQQERIAAQLQQNLAQIRRNADAEIRRVLTPDQRIAFEQVVHQRKVSVGSSRDAKYF